MAGKTTIEWATDSWNPVRGCSIVSKGCTNCYAMRQAHRSSGARGAYEGLTKLTKGGPVWTGEIRLVPELLEQPLKWKRPRRIFVNSMSDLFHENVPGDFIDQVLSVVKLCHHRGLGHIFQVLTKRAERMMRFMRHYQPLANLWLGVSAEDQKTFDERAYLLAETPAAVRFLSLEPLLGPISWNGHTVCIPWARGEAHGGRSYSPLINFIHWVIVGGESGPGARPMHPDWVRQLRDQCAADRVAFFFKQWGAWAPIARCEDLPGKPAMVRKGDCFIARDGSRMVNLGDDLSCELESEAAPMRNVGKKAAGRLLDGRTHDEYPPFRHLDGR